LCGKIKATKKNELSAYLLKNYGVFPLECEIAFSLFITVFKGTAKRNRIFPLELYYTYFAEKLNINLQGDVEKELENLKERKI